MVRHKNRNAKIPAEGTKRRAVFDKMMTKQGMSRKDFPAISGSSFGAMLESFRDDMGFDVRNVGHVPSKRKAYYIYRIVGRNLWDGGYESYIDPEDYADEIDPEKSKAPPRKG